MPVVSSSAFAIRVDVIFEPCVPKLTFVARIGLGVLFGKLQQGVVENQQVLTIARMRAEAEDVYGQRLAEIVPAADRMTGGFSRDDGASVRKVRYVRL
jgi:hypothetical protein